MTNRTDLVPLRVNVFPGGFNWGLYVGIDEGFFRDEGLRIEVQETPNSVTQMTDFAQGKFDIAMTAVDNIVAYVEGQGEAPIGAQPEFFAFMGSDSGFLSLVVGRGLTEIAALRGKRLSVDAMTTGYAFVLYDMLRRADLASDSYAVARVGGMVQRWNDLNAGGSDATLLSAPYNVAAMEHGLHEIAKAVDVLGPYQGNVAAARRTWAAANHAHVVGYVSAYRRAIAWLYDADHRDAAIAILRRNLPNMTAATAQASYGELLHPRFGFYRSCEIDEAGLRCVLDLRSRYGRPALLLKDPEKYIDRSFVRACVNDESSGPSAPTSWVKAQPEA